MTFRCHNCATLQPLDIKLGAKYYSYAGIKYFKEDLNQLLALIICPFCKKKVYDKKVMERET